MVFCLESYFEVMCCCLHALHKSPGNFNKRQVHLPCCSQPQGFIPPSKRPCRSTPLLSHPLACWVPSQSISAPPLPPKTFNPPGKGRWHEGLPTYALNGVTYLCAKPNTLVLKTAWMVTDNAMPSRSSVQSEA